MADPPNVSWSELREPLWECPHCNEKRYSVIGCWGSASHLWEKHKVPGHFSMNGRLVYFGPRNPIIRWLFYRTPRNVTKAYDRDRQTYFYVDHVIQHL